MKGFMIGVLTAACLAIAGAWVLDTRVQQTVEQRFQTTGVRL